MNKKDQVQAVLEQLMTGDDSAVTRLIGEMTQQQTTQTQALLAMAGEHSRVMAAVVQQQHDLMRELMHRQLVQVDPRAAFQSARFTDTLRRAGVRHPVASQQVPPDKPSSGPGPGAGNFEEEEDLEPVDREEILGDINPRGTGVAGFHG